jgi:hypothetical protein
VSAIIGQASAWASPGLFCLLVRDQLSCIHLIESPSDSASVDESAPTSQEVCPLLFVMPPSSDLVSRTCLAVTAFYTSLRVCLGIEHPKQSDWVPQKLHPLHLVTCCVEVKLLRGVGPHSHPEQRGGWGRHAPPVLDPSCWVGVARLASRS